MEGSHPAQPAEPGTLNTTLLDTPEIEKMTEKESAHPKDVDACSNNKSTESTDDEVFAEKTPNQINSIVTVRILFIKDTGNRGGGGGYFSMI